MRYSDNALVKDPRGTLARHFGFERNFRPVVPRSGVRIESGDSGGHRCMMCGEGGKSGVKDRKLTLIKENTNAFYAFAERDSRFICDHCLYMYNAYQKKMQKGLDRAYGDIGDIVVYEDRIERRRMHSDEKNELYDLFVSPPKEAFMLLLKNYKGTSFESGFFAALPTIDSEIFCVGYGYENLFVSRGETLACMEDAAAIFDRHRGRKLNLSDDVLFNRAVSEEYRLWYTGKLRADAAFMGEYRYFIGRYDRATRFVAKIMFRRFLREKKENKKTKRKGKK